MCGRFINLNKINKLKKIFHPCETINGSDFISYNIAPTQSPIIITYSNDFSIKNAKWGFKYKDKNNNEKNIINSRIETINDKIIFKESFKRRKCLIPSNGYFEWCNLENEKKPYFIKHQDLDTIFFAGIWKNIDFQNKKIKTFTIITKNSRNNAISKIHGRMPVLFNIEEGINYLENNNNNFLNVNFTSIMDKNLEYYHIDKYVNNPINNSIKCIEPINNL